MGSTEDQLVSTSAFVMAPSAFPGLDVAGRAGELIEGTSTLGVGPFGHLPGTLQQLQQLQPNQLFQLIRQEAANSTPKDQSVAHLQSSQQRSQRHDPSDQLNGKENQRPGGAAGPTAVIPSVGLASCSAGGGGALLAHLAESQSRQQQKELSFGGLPNLQGLQGRHNAYEADDSEPEEITSDLHDRQGPQTPSGHLHGLFQTSPPAATGQHLSHAHVELPPFGKTSVIRETRQASSSDQLVNSCGPIVISSSGSSPLKQQPLGLLNVNGPLLRLPSLKQEDTGDHQDENRPLSGFLPTFNFPSSHGLSIHPINPVNSGGSNSNLIALAASSLESSSSLTSGGQANSNGLQAQNNNNNHFTPSTAPSPLHFSTAHSPHSQASVIMDPQHLYQLQAAQQVAAAQQLVSLGQAAAAAHGGQPPPVSGLQLLNYANQNNSNNNSSNNGSSEHNLAVALGVSGYAGVGGVAATQNAGSATPEKPWPCPSCKIPFASAIELQAHLTTHTQKPGQVKVEGRNIPCEVCGKLFATQDRMKAHMRSAHQADKNCSCSICGSGGVCPQSAGFSYRCKLLDHMRSHSGERPFHCDVCGRGFSQKNHLTRHMMIHTGERPFACEFCGRGFYRKDKLTRHRRTHTGWPPGEAPKATNGEQVGMALALMNQSVQPSSGSGGASGQQGGGGGGGGRGGRRATINPVTCHCEICGRGFTERAHLARHHMIHTGETPFICPVCQKGFYRKDKLNGHMRTHTGMSPLTTYLATTT
ncbi:transcription factor Sp3-like isoform X5 [Varroa destructor]|uniref:C2H2-type domain-containing protein n=1 Tax=Varroa destructor TaxID=109461 RepID=A0A7M7KHM4_VARDE|nr:transcription factor Sp3-like isoform X5 [Varroa destructor]